MVLIYSHITSPRLQYICRFIFRDLLGVEFSITIDSEAFLQHEGPCINYSDRSFDGKGYWIRNHGLLFEEVILPQQISCFSHQGKPAFFRCPPCDHAFDVFAASFYLLSRYEEYLPYTRDLYGRFSHENALAFKQGFLQIPLVNYWVMELGKALQERNPVLRINQQPFKFIPTYDIDMAWSYLHKGLVRNAGGFFRSPSMERTRVLLGMKPDPFDAYDWLDSLHDKHQLKPLYFFLVAEKNGKYDKNILPHKEAFWKLVKRHAKRYETGLHPSWQSGDNPSLLKKEKAQLEAMTENGQAVTVSRQHYIRFDLPSGYRRLLEAGITDDHSMGYGSINGFRASVASAFQWYDLEREEETPLRIHPFCFMEANSYYEQHYTPQQARDELAHYRETCREVNGTMITIWHNNFLGNDKTIQEWKGLYQEFIVGIKG